MQTCPEYAKPPTTHLATAVVILQFLVTITPALPPNSNTTFFLPASSFIFQPISGEPVKVSNLKRLSVTNKLPVTLSIGKIETAPLGNEVLSIILANSSVERGVALAGFKIIGQPAAIAGAIL